jgi:MinD-like ATPase involved in chromosome partitioning or flagellar assembly
MGKSTLSLYLARILAQDGDKVLLLDMDPVYSSLSHLVNDGLSNWFPEAHWPAGNDEAALASITKNLDFLSNLACNEISSSPSTDNSGFPRALRTELSPYNFMIIDTQTGLNELNLSLLQDADTAILITTPDATSVFETYSLIKAANSYLSTKKLYLVINKVIDKEASKKAHQELNFALKYFLNCEILLLGMIDDDNSLCSGAKELILFSDTKFQQSALSTIHQVSQKVKNSKTRKFAQR